MDEAHGPAYVVLDLTSMPEAKRCPACGETKPLADFHRSERCHDGRDTWCASCRHERRRRSHGPAGGCWTRSDADAAAQDRVRFAKQREEDSRRDEETVALLRAQREEIAGR